MFYKNIKLNYKIVFICTNFRIYIFEDEIQRKKYVILKSKGKKTT